MKSLCVCVCVCVCVCDRKGDGKAIFKIHMFLTCLYMWILADTLSEAAAGTTTSATSSPLMHVLLSLPHLQLFLYFRPITVDYKCHFLIKSVCTL